MSKAQKKIYKYATGKIDYKLTNDCMFQAVMRANKKVLKGFLCSLLHLHSNEVKTITILNPFELSEMVRDKIFILDIKILLNNAMVINIELQVRGQEFWNDRSLSYLCRTFDNLKKGESYSDVRPAYHIGILNFTPFPEHPEFYASNKKMNVKKHYIYNDKFTLNVLDLNQIKLATDEDKKWKLDLWARLFKAKTWEDLKMLAQEDKIFNDAGETIFKFNQDEKVRYWCEAFEEQERFELSIKQSYKKFLAEKDAIIAEKESAIAERDFALAEKDSALAEKDSALAQQKEENQRLLAEIQKLKEAYKE